VSHLDIQAALCSPLSQATLKSNIQVSHCDIQAALRNIQVSHLNIQAALRNIQVSHLNIQAALQGYSQSQRNPDHSTRVTLMVTYITTQAALKHGKLPVKPNNKQIAPRYTKYPGTSIQGGK
jgi:hypothetical protein